MWTVVALFAALILSRFAEPPGSAEAPAPARPETTHRANAHGAIEQVFRARASGVMVDGAGRVDRVLRDDEKGSRHQRFIVALDSGHTVLIAHNIDLAPRVAGLSRGDEVAFRGQYEFNERGGVVHWTHHDPGGHRAGGWIEHGGQRYR